MGKKHLRSCQDGSGKTPPRPIVAKISNWKVKEVVLREAPWKNKARRCNVLQRPSKENTQRKNLQAYVIWDRLIVKDKDGKVIKPRSRAGPSDDGEGLFSDDEEDDKVTFKQGYFK